MPRDCPPRRPLMLLLSMALAAGFGCRSAGLPDGLHWVRNSAEYRAAVHQAYALATRQIDRLAEGREPGTWAIVADADETVVDNSQYQKELAERGESHSQAAWDAWVRRRQAPPLPGSVAFLAHVRELGGRIAIVTNRRQGLCAATEDDFRAYDIPFDVILCRPDEGPSDKEPRWQRVASGQASPELPPLEILMWLGDNIRDFPGGSQETRDADAAGFREFGSRYIVVPNPMYGSWLGNPRR